MARHVPHLLVEAPWEAPVVALGSDQLSHIGKVLRRGAGDAVTYTDGRGRSGSGTFDGSGIVRGPEADRPRPPAPMMAVAPPSERDRQRFVVEKLGELGITRLVWLETANGDGRPPSHSKAAAWAQSALEQSRRAWLLEVSESMASIGDLPAGTVFADRGGSQDPLGPDVPCVAVGPAGGWAPREVPDGAERVDLGDGVLRTETAAIVVAATVSRTSPSRDHSEW